MSNRMKILREKAGVGIEPSMTETTPWWQPAVIYQIYPRSFADTTGDGTGDLRGITAHLDYLVALGVDALWISPFYPSPMADFGYDVADYTGVDPLFGTLADFDQLLAEAHARGLKVLLDFVPNHTSDEHPWFLESRSSRTNPRRDWYLWRDPRPGPQTPGERLPNNWMSHFGGPAWTWDETTQQFYCHSFLRRQPDLNWRNPQVRAAVYAAMRFWLEKGVDGFRMDVLWLLIKDDRFRDNPPNPDYTGGNTLWSVLPKYTADQPETHEIVREMRALLDVYGQRVLIGEIYLPLPELVKYYGAQPESPQLVGAHLPFNFHLIQSAWEAPLAARLIAEYEALLPPGAWPNWVLGNHDQKRLASRVGAEQARVAAMLLLTLRGTPTLYYGDELGMPDATSRPDQVQDPAEKNQPGMGQGRDPERSPMLWNGAPNAGFTTDAATPWLPLVDDWKQYTVEAESAQPNSMLALYRALLHLRREHEALHAGAVSEVRANNGVLSYVRTAADGARFQIHLNMTATTELTDCLPGQLILNTFLDQTHADVGGLLGLRPNEGIVVRVGVPA